MGGHIANQAAILSLYSCRNCILQSSTAKIFKIIIGHILQLQRVRSTNQAISEGRGNTRVSQLPNLALRILKGTIAINHNLNMLAGFL